MTLGQRNKLLLAFRVHRFGSRFEAVSQCQKCRGQVELNFDIGAIIAADTGIPEGDFHTDCKAYHVRFRLPTTGDIVSLAELVDPVRCRDELLNRCILSAKRGGDEISSVELPEDVLRDVSEKMEKSDPLAAIYLKTNCPHCRHQWEAPFDIATFLANEIDTWVKRLLVEIHILGKAYHWSEADILTMGPWRRRIYLSMLRE
jgi:hypothetical protein